MTPITSGGVSHLINNSSETQSTNSFNPVVQALKVLVVNSSSGNENKKRYRVRIFILLYVL